MRAFNSASGLRSRAHFIGVFPQCRRADIVTTGKCKGATPFPLDPPLSAPVGTSRKRVSQKRASASSFELTPIFPSSGLVPLEVLDHELQQPFGTVERACDRVRQLSYLLVKDEY